MLVADVTIFLEIARILSVYNILKPLNAKGMPIDPVIGYTNGTVRLDLPGFMIMSMSDPFIYFCSSRAEDFKCRIEPRSEKARALIDAMTL